MNHRMIILTDLAAPEADFRPEWRLPQLEARLRLAKRRRAAHYYQWLASQADSTLHEPVHWARVGQEAAVAGSYWVTPLNVNVGLSSIAVDSEAVWSPETASARLRVLNQHFKEDGLVFEESALGLRLNSARRYEWLTEPSERLIGRDLRTASVRGQDAPALKKILNEIQMLLHTQSSTPQCLWVWGYGTVAPPRWPRAVRLKGSNALLQTWLAPAGASTHSVEEDCIELMPTIDSDFAGGDWATRLDQRLEESFVDAANAQTRRVSLWLDGTVFEWRGADRWNWRRWRGVKAWWESLC
jgi:hypothetical protein